MNINKICIACLLLVVALCACTDHALTDPDDNTPAAGLRFTVPAEANTRITYDGRFSTFEEGDEVGCIIATRPAESNDAFAYAAHAKWHYHNEVLLLDEVFTVGTWDWNSKKYTRTEVTDLIQRLDATSESGYLKLPENDNTKNIEYAFYFYYPYTDEVLLAEDVKKAIETYNADTSTPFYRLLSYPNCATNENLTFKNQHNNGVTLSNGIDDVYAYCNLYSFTGISTNSKDESSYSNLNHSWLTYPCFVNHTQQTKAQLNNSDFLWIDCQTMRDGQTRITTDTGIAPIPLAFKKKTATIEVISEAELEDVYFQSEYNGLVRGMQINLQSGVLTSYDNITETSVQKTNQRYTGQFLPCDLATLTTPVVEEEKGKKFRLTLAPQTAFNCNLVFKIDETTGHDHINHTIALGDRISQLREGYLYTIRINKKGDYSIVIQDWVFGRIEIIDPDDGLKEE